MRSRRPWPALALCVLALAGLGAPSAALGAPAQSPRSALLVFLPSGAAAGARQAGTPGDQFESALARVDGVSLAIMSASQGTYSTAQLLLDITQGARIASSQYSAARPPAMSLEPSGQGALVRGWAAVRRRAEDAPQLLEPGLLASRLAAGGGYAAGGIAEAIDGVAAADRAGHVAALSRGSARTLPARIAALQRSTRFVVADLPAGPEGYAELSGLIRRRAAGELVIVVQRVPDGPEGQLLWAAIAGLPGGGGRELTSQTTKERGLISAVDLAPTILAHLQLTPIPGAMRGFPIRTDGALDAASLRAEMARLRVIGPRRLRALGVLLCAWALVMLIALLWPGPRGGARRAWALRIGALGVLWAPAATLIAAALEPGAAVEYATIAVLCLGLGALTDALLPWPRAPLLPAVVTLAALVLDALSGTQLLLRSLLGPDPILGARFYGIGNELKSGLAVLVFAATAAALYPTVRAGAGARARARRRGAAAMAGAGALLAVIEGSARIGAGVGGVILVCAGAAVATVLMLPGRLTRRRALIALCAPVAGLVVLAGLDLAAAHGGGHYTGSILHARSATDLRDVLVRRYTAAWQELHNHAMPVATALALIACAIALRRRERLLSVVDYDPVWVAALAGGLAAGVVGALVEDSGPVLFVVAAFALGCVLSYLWGRPPARRTPGTPRAAPPRALRRSAAPSR